MLPKILLNLAFQEPFGRSPRAALAWPGERDEFLVVWLFVGFFFSVCVLLFFLGVFFFFKLPGTKKEKKEKKSKRNCHFHPGEAACVRACVRGRDEGQARALRGAAGRGRGVAGAPAETCAC